MGPGVNVLLRAHFRDLCELLDLERCELAAVRKTAEAGDYGAAPAAYRDRRADLSGILDMGHPFGFRPWNAANAGQLRMQGVVAIAQYGEFSTFR